MGGTAHQPSRPPMAARCQALPSTHLSDTQQQSGTSNLGRAARAVSHPTLNLRKKLETQTQPDSSLTLYAPASHVLRRPEVPEGILWRQAPTTNKKGQTKPRKAPAAISSSGSAEPALFLFKPTELAPTREPINRLYTVGCALNTALKQALSQPKLPSSSRTASDSVKWFQSLFLV
eukprot:scaffold33730_cov124-Isochrysis_galbana.AAC.1